MTAHQRFLHCAVTLSIVLSLAITDSAFPSKRARSGKRTPVRIAFERSELQLGPNQTVEVKAKVLDARDNQIPNARIVWEVPQSAEDSIVVRPVDQAETDILITAKEGSSPSRSVTLHAHVGRASSDLTIHLQNSAPAEIVFPDGNKVELPVLGRKTVRAYVLDAQGNRMRTPEVSWSLADPDHEAFVLVGPNVNNDGINSVDISWLAGKPELKTPSEVKLVARSGDHARGIVTIDYKAPKAEVTKITLEPKELIVRPGESPTVQVTVRGEDERLLKVEPEAEVADESAKKFIKVLVLPDKKTISVVGSYGDEKSPPPDFIKTVLVVRAGGGVATIPVVYQRDAAVVDWDILPPNIVGDNYGRTIKKDYYCIEVTIQNNSGADLALAGLRFDHGGVRRPNTSYATVHGSLARRKITHPRAMTLAIIDGMGSLMTGFNPFFHNINHAKNFSQFIDILSNPLAKGLDKAWMDPYPGELARFEQDVLRDDKMIPNAGIFKTKVFIPKRALFTNDEKKKREDLAEVRKALGILWVLGYKFQKGPVQNIATAP